MIRTMLRNCWTMRTYVVHGGGSHGSLYVVGGVGLEFTLPTGVLGRRRVDHRTIQRQRDLADPAELSDPGKAPDQQHRVERAVEPGRACQVPVAGGGVGGRVGRV